MKKIAVVILNYCNDQETKNCVESIQIQKGVFVEIIIVDNGSPNGSYERLAKEYRNVPGIYVLRVHKNYGFAKGNNIGIQYACHLDAEFVYLLNSDIVLQGETCIADLLKEYQSGVGVIGARLIERNGRERKSVYDYPFAPEKWWYFNCLLFNSLNVPLLADYWMRKLEKGRRTEVLQGSNLMLTPDYLKKCGLLYPYTFLYCEEALLFLQCRDKHLKQVKAKEAKVFHRGAQSSKFLYKDDVNRTIQNQYILRSQFHVLFYPMMKWFVRPLKMNLDRAEKWKSVRI